MRLRMRHKENDGANPRIGGDYLEKAIVISISAGKPRLRKLAMSEYADSPE
jgi:hypothetical protein